MTAKAEVNSNSERVENKMSCAELAGDDDFEG